MHISSLPKIMNGLLTLLILNAGLANASICGVRQGVSTGSGSDRVTADSNDRDCQDWYSVATAPGTDLFLKIAQEVDERPLSPCLAALQDRLKSGDREALDSFWKEITERGAPIVEP